MTHGKQTCRRLDLGNGDLIRGHLGGHDSPHAPFSSCMATLLNAAKFSQLDTALLCGPLVIIPHPHFIHSHPRLTAAAKDGYEASASAASLADPDIHRGSHDRSRSAVMPTFSSFTPILGRNCSSSPEVHASSDREQPRQGSPGSKLPTIAACSRGPMQIRLILKGTYDDYNLAQLPRSPYNSAKLVAHSAVLSFHVSPRVQILHDPCSPPGLRPFLLLAMTNRAPSPLLLH